MTATTIVVCMAVITAVIFVAALPGQAVAMWPITIPVIFGVLASPLGVGIGIFIVLLRLNLRYGVRPFIVTCIRAPCTEPQVQCASPACRRPTPQPQDRAALARWNVLE